MGLAVILLEEVRVESMLGASSQWTANDQGMVCNSAFFSCGPVGTPCPPCTAVSSFIKWGWCFHHGLTPSYLTDILWGLLKLCLQYFQFLEKNYLWTFQVLYRYISDLSFLFAIILVSCFYLSYKTTVNVMTTSDSYQSSEHPPTHLTDAGLTVRGTSKDDLSPWLKIWPRTQVSQICIRI